jgi:hypothetical protein
MYWWEIMYYTTFPFTETKIVLGRTEDEARLKADGNQVFLVKQLEKVENYETFLNQR